MNESKKEQEKKIESNDLLSYKIEFKRFNKVVLLNGFLFIILAIINIPFLYNPETYALEFKFAGKPNFGFGGNISFYVFVGLIPLIMGVLFIMFSIFTARKINILIYTDGKCKYVKKGKSRLLSDTEVEFDLKDKLQHVNWGKRHQRFVIWVPVAVMMFLIFQLLDYVNFLDVSFDVTTMFFNIEYSVKAMILINVFIIVAALLSFTLFPRKLFRLDTSEEFIKFDYNKMEISRMNEASSVSTASTEKLPHILLFELIKKENLNEDVLSKNINLPEPLKQVINKKDFKHLPLFTLITNISLFLIVFLPQFIPNFFLGSFTLKIEYFIMIAAFYFTVRTLQNNCFRKQEIISLNEGSDLIIKRDNRLFGNNVEFFASIEKIEQELAPRTPHYLEHVLFFFPLMEIVWLFALYFTFIEYFFTQNLYTILYFIVIICIFVFTASEYISPRPMLSITPKYQGKNRKKSEKFSIYFPLGSLLKLPPLKDALKKKGYFKKSFQGLMLILIPIIFTVIWIILSNLNIVPPLSNSIF